MDQRKRSSSSRLNVTKWLSRINTWGVASVQVSLSLSLGCTRCYTQNAGRRQSLPVVSPPPSETPLAAAQPVLHEPSNAVLSDSSEANSTPPSAASMQAARNASTNLNEGHGDAEAVKMEANRAMLGSDGCHVLAIGDSLTDPQSNGGGYLKPWHEQCPECRFTNIGRGGAMVNQMLARLRRHLLENDVRYSHWVIFGGVNDLYSDITAHRTLDKIERDLAAMYALGHQRHSLVVAITVAPWGGFHRWYTNGRGINTTQLNQWIVQQQAMGAVDFAIESGAYLSCGDSKFLCPKLTEPYRDGLHFGAEGHRRLGQSLLTVLDGAACRLQATQK